MKEQKQNRKKKQRDYTERGEVRTFVKLDEEQKN